MKEEARFPLYDPVFNTFACIAPHILFPIRALSILLPSNMRWIMSVVSFSIPNALRMEVLRKMCSQNPIYYLFRLARI